MNIKLNQKLSFHKKRKAHLKLGKWGEDTACKLLLSKNFKIIIRNYRQKNGELDIVALDGQTLVFIEVKTLSKYGKYRPMDNYHIRQNKRNILAAKSYLKFVETKVDSIRFDFIEVIGTPRWLFEIVHHQNFFRTNIYNLMNL